MSIVGATSIGASRSRLQQGLRGCLRHLSGNRQLQVGAVIVLGMCAVALVAPWITPFDPTATSSDVLAAPSRTHWFGTDTSGMDIFSRVLHAPRVDIVIAVTATLLAMGIGMPIGIRAGFRPGFTSEAVSRLFDIVQAFPFFILAITLLTAFGASATNMIIVIAFVNAPIYFRLMRGQALNLKNRTFMDAARVAGSGERDLMYRHILPNALPPALAQMSITVAWAIILTAGVSFVGAGVRAPTPEWGLMIAGGAPQMITGQWWPALFPGLALAVSVVGYALVANALTDLSDPRRRHG